MDDAQDLRRLALAHYAVGALTALLALIPAIGIYLGVHLTRHPEALGEWHGFLQELRFPPEMIGQMVVYAAGSAVLLVLLHAIIIAWVGWYISKACRYWVVYIFSLLDCTYVPFGTIIGVWALVVLHRPSVKARFGLSPRAPKGRQSPPQSATGR